MKRFFAFAAIVAAAMSVVSCGSYTYLEVVDHRETTEQRLAFTNSYVMTTPFVADLELVDSSMVEIDVPFEKTVTRELIKNLEGFKYIAITEAIQKLRKEQNMDVDLLLGVLLDVKTDFPSERRDVPGKLVITVRGYPAKYVDFRKATKEDVNLIYTASMSQRPIEGRDPVASAPVQGTTTLKENLQYIR